LSHYPRTTSNTRLRRHPFVATPTVVLFAHCDTPRFTLEAVANRRSQQRRSGRRDAVTEIKIRGDGFHLTLGVAGYESERMGDSYDDNWLSGEVTLEVAQPPAA
jgi:hypothetical protein